MQKLIEKANSQLSRLKLLQRGNSLSVQGTFPPKKGDGIHPKQYQVSLKCKANNEGLKVALAKAKAMESDLVMERWQWTEEDSSKLLVKDALTQYTNYYWEKNEKSRQKEYYYKICQEKVYGYLPQDKVFDEKLLREAVLSFPTGSYARYWFIINIRPVARYFNINIDYSQFGKYTPKQKTLPLLEEIIESYQSCTNERTKWMLGIFFTFGLRPHEIFKSSCEFDRGIDSKTGKQLPNIMVVNDTTKTGKRTAYPLTHPDINVFELEIPEFKVDLTLPNTRLGHQVSKRFIPFPFTAYQLRHYYAVHGAMRSVSPVTMALWMGHSLNEHFKSYASLLGDIESEAIWLNLEN
jgi:integrase